MNASSQCPRTTDSLTISLCMKVSRSVTKLFNFDACLIPFSIPKGKKIKHWRHKMKSDFYEKMNVTRRNCVMCVNNNSIWVNLFLEEVSGRYGCACVVMLLKWRAEQKNPARTEVWKKWELKWKEIKHWRHDLLLLLLHTRPNLPHLM